jgi:nicotinamidase-related amidase
MQQLLVLAFHLRVYHSQIDKKLKELKLEHLLFSGLFGTQCVRNSMIDGQKLGYNVFTSTSLVTEHMVDREKLLENYSNYFYSKFLL